MKKKILILCPYPENVAAGQRLKYEQYFHIWRQNNYEVTVSPFMDNNLWKVIYKKGYYLIKIISIIKGYWRRIKIINKIKNYDFVYVFMWVTPFGTHRSEKKVRKYSKRLIYDLEDNILENKKNKFNLIDFFLNRQKKIHFLIKSADHVITSSPYLSDYYCRNLNKYNSASFITSSLNINYYKISKSTNKKITIGWTGTFSSKIYLESIEKVLKKLAKEIDFKLIIIGNFDYKIEGVDYEVIQWNSDNEIEDLNKIDIGIYPLIDSKWVLGKSGLKALQYMAIGIPTVATDVGTSSDIIENMKDGILVNNDDDWISALKYLISNPNARKQMGNNARKKIESFYSTEIIKYKYLNIFDSLSKINVGMIFSSGEMGGAEKSLTKMAQSDEIINYKIYLFGKKGPFVDWLKGIDSYSYSFGSNINIISLLKSIYILKNSNLDIVYVSGLKISLILRFFLKINSKLKFVQAVRHSPFSNSNFDKLFRNTERISKSLIDFYITNSFSAKEVLINKSNINEDKISTVYNGLDFFPSKNEIIPINNRDNIVITVANVNYRKGHIEYLKIIKKLVENFNDLKFIFIGRDDLNGVVQKEIKRFNLENYIEMLGFKKDINPYYKIAKLSVLPSTWGEGCPTSIIESMSWGTPVLTYDVGGCSELITNNKDGIIVPRNNENKLYESIKKLLKDENLLHFMSKNGLDNSKKFKLDKCTNEHKNIFSNLLKEEV